MLMEKEEETMALKEVFFAGGCFWGLEKFLRLIQGVQSTEVGYLNGAGEEAGYKDVCAGSGHAEVVRVVFDDGVLSLRGLVEMFFTVIDPFSLNRQGNDRGVQYRTGIYARDGGLLEEIGRNVQEMHARLGAPTAVEVKPVINYCRAEDYHQDYLGKNPGGYCHIGAADFERARAYLDPSLRK